MTNSALLKFDSTEEEFARMNLTHPVWLDSPLQDSPVAPSLPWFADIVLSDEEDAEDEDELEDEEYEEEGEDADEENAEEYADDEEYESEEYDDDDEESDDELDEDYEYDDDEDIFLSKSDQFIFVLALISFLAVIPITLKY